MRLKQWKREACRQSRQQQCYPPTSHTSLGSPKVMHILKAMFYYLDLFYHKNFIHICIINYRSHLFYIQTCFVGSLEGMCLIKFCPFFPFPWDIIATNYPTSSPLNITVIWNGPLYSALMHIYVHQPTLSLSTYLCLSVYKSIPTSLSLSTYIFLSHQSHSYIPISFLFFYELWPWIIKKMFPKTNASLWLCSQCSDPVPLLKPPHLFGVPHCSETLNNFCLWSCIMQMKSNGII